MVVDMLSVVVRILRVKPLVFECMHTEQQEV